MTRAGALFIVLTLLFGFAAVNTGNNLLYLLVSAFLGFMAVSGLLGHLNLQRVVLNARPGQEVYAGLPATLDVFVINRHRWLARFMLRVRVAGESALVPVLPAAGQRVVSLPILLPLRGYQKIPEIRLESCFPVNFFIRSQRVPQEDDFLVFPRPVHASLPGRESAGSPRTDQITGRSGSDGDILGIDDYRSGDPLRAVHWKLSARQDSLKVKKQARLTDASVILDPDDFSGSLEERLGCCAYLINHYCRLQRAVGLTLLGRTLAPAVGARHKHRLLSELALYDQD